MQRIATIRLLALRSASRRASTSASSKNSLQSEKPAINNKEHYFDPETDPDVLKAVSEGSRTRQILFPIVAGLAALYIGFGAAPLLGQGSVTGAVRLLGARDEFLQRSGADRARALASFSTAGAAQLAKEGAVPLLLRLSTGPGDQTTRRAAVKALAAVAQEEGAAAALAACPDALRLHDLVMGADPEAAEAARAALGSAGLMTSFRGPSSSKKT